MRDFREWYRDGKPIYTAERVHFVLNHCALGDMISSLPAVAYARQTTSQAQAMCVWVPEHQVPLVKHLMGRLRGLSVMPLHLFANLDDPNHQPPFEDLRLRGPGNAFSNGCISGQVTRNRMPLVDYAHLLLLDRVPRSDEERNYPHTAPLGPRPLQEEYVVISVGATSDNKIIPPHVIEPVIRWCAEHDYKPVILGKSDTIVKASGENMPLKVRTLYESVSEDARSLALDLRDKTDLLLARDYCGHSAAVVGVDGGMLHLAGTTNAPIVYGYTTIDPRDRGIVRFSQMNWNLVHVGPRDLACTGCQGNMTLLVNHDFRFCIYRDNLCVDRLHADDFIGALTVALIRR